MRLALLLLAALALPAPAQSLKDWKGASTPALELSDADGKLHRLADYRGKVVLVNFWATWCGPCREEMPSMETLRVALQDRPFVVLAVNVGEGGRVARDFGEKMSLGFPLLLDRDTKTTKAWGARILPASFVVGPDGKIRYSYLGAIDWTDAGVRAAIERLMPQKRGQSNFPVTPNGAPPQPDEACLRPEKLDSFASTLAPQDF